MEVTGRSAAQITVNAALYPMESPLPPLASQGANGY
jgi:hypothetical protein